MKTKAQVLLTVAILLLTVWNFSSARATAPRVTAALFLARVCVNEAGWDCWENRDGYLIHEVFLRGAEHDHVSYLSYARHYSRRISGLRPTDSARIAWTSNLLPSGAEPANWPQVVTRRQRDGSVQVDRHPSWSTFRSQWSAVYQRALDISATLTLDNIDEWGVCDAPTHDWGSRRLDHNRAVALGLRKVNCGHFETVPATDLLERKETRDASPHEDSEEGASEGEAMADSFEVYRVTSNEGWARPSRDREFIDINPEEEVDRD